MDTGKLDVGKLTKEFHDFVASARYEQMDESEQHAYSNTASLT